MNNSMLSNASNVSIMDSIKDGTWDTTLHIKLLIGISCACFLVIGIPGNLLVIVAYCKTKWMHSRLHLSFLNLSITDLALLILCLPFVVADLFSEGQLRHGKFICQATSIMENTATLTSNLTVLLIALERYKGISRPLSIRNNWTRFQMVAVVIVTWMISSVTSIPLLFMTFYEEERILEKSPNNCFLVIDTTWNMSYIVLEFLLFFVFELFVLICLTTKMSKSLLDQSKKIKKNVDNITRRIISGRKRIVIMLITVNLSFLLLLFPHRVLRLWIIFSQKETSVPLRGYDSIFTFTRILVFMKCAVDPVIYNCTSASFRAAAIDVLCCRREEDDGITRTRTGSSMVALQPLGVAKNLITLRDSAC